MLKGLRAAAGHRAQAGGISGNYFMAVGALSGDTTMLRSTDGITWDEISNDGNHHHYAVEAALDNGFLAAGGNAATGDSLLHSSEDDGLTWTQRSAPDNVSIRGGGSDGSMIIFVGDDALDTYIITSIDGTTWIERTNPGTGKISRDVTHNGSQWILVGENIMRSSNGITWTESQSASNLFGVAWNGSVWCAVGGAITSDSQVYTSPDGITWTQRSTGTGYSESLYDIIWDGSQFVASGTYEANAGSPYIITSADGITWSQKTGPLVTSTATALSYSPELDLYALAISAALYTSPDLITWTVRTNPASNINDIVWVPPV